MRHSWLSVGVAAAIIAAPVAVLATANASEVPKLHSREPAPLAEAVSRPRATYSQGVSTSAPSEHGREYVAAACRQAELLWNRSSEGPGQLPDPCNRDTSFSDRNLRNRGTPVVCRVDRRPRGRCWDHKLSPHDVRCLPAHGG